MCVSVLLLGDSESKRAQLKQALGAADFRVFTAATAAEALSRLKQDSIQVLLTANTLPDMSLPELLLNLADWPELRVMLLEQPQDPALNAWLKARAVSCFDADNEGLLTLPHSFAQQRHSPRSHHFHFNSLKLFDLVQILALSLREVQLYLAEAHSAQEGFLYVAHGQIRHAIWGTLRGEAAFEAMMQLRSGYFVEAEKIACLEIFGAETRLNQLTVRSKMRQIQSKQPKRAQSLSGDLHALQLSDVLQILSSSRQSRDIRVLDWLRNESGRITLCRGKLEYASLHETRGLSALQRMMTLETAQFHVQAYRAPETHNLEGSFAQQVLQWANVQGPDVQAPKRPRPRSYSALTRYTGK